MIAAHPFVFLGGCFQAGCITDSADRLSVNQHKPLDETLSGDVKFNTVKPSHTPTFGFTTGQIVSKLELEKNRNL